jgi:hypothetical protein
MIVFGEIQMLQEKFVTIAVACGWNEKGNHRVSKCALRVTVLLHLSIEGCGKNALDEVWALKLPVIRPVQIEG